MLRSFGECVPCERGFYSKGNFSLCMPCPQGTYSNVNGTIYCTPCNSDQYCPAG